MSSDEKRKMMDILARVEKESADNVEEDNDDLHERLQDLDLDKDTSKIWSRLTEQVCKTLVNFNSLHAELFTSFSCVLLIVFLN